MRLSNWSGRGQRKVPRGGSVSSRLKTSCIHFTGVRPKPKYERLDRLVVEPNPKYSSSDRRNGAISPMMQSTGRRPAAIAGTHGQRSVQMERHHESPYRRSRAGHAHRQPDLRSVGADRCWCSELLRPRLWTELPLLSVRPLRAPAVERNASPLQPAFGHSGY